MSKLLYISKINDPTNAGAFPPHVMEILNEVIELSATKSLNGTGHADTIILFESEAELNTFLDKYRITDAALLADIDLWRTTHRISYSTEVYSLSQYTSFVPIVT